METRTLRSTEKSWYIFRNNYHLGPLRLEDLRKKFQDGSLTAQDQIWGEGLTDWSAVANYPDLLRYLQRSEKDFLRDIALGQLKQERLVQKMRRQVPPVGTEVVPGTVVRPVEYLQSSLNHWDQEPQESHVHHLIALPALPDLRPLPPLPPLPTPIETERFEQLGSETIHQPLLKRWQRWTVGCTIWTISALVLWQLIPHDSKRLSLPTSLSLEQSKHFQKLAKLNPELTEVGVAVLPQSSDILVVANKAYSGPLDVTFTSIEKKVLGEIPVVFVATVPFKDHLAHISKIRFNQGNKFLPGYYQVEMVQQRTDLPSKFYRFWQHSQWGQRLAWPFPFEVGFKYRGVHLLSLDSEQEFNEKLKQLVRSTPKREIKPRNLNLNLDLNLNVSLEGFNTILALTRKVQAIFNEQLPTVKSNKDFSNFELQYAREAGGLLQAMIMENMKKVQSIPNKKSLEKVNMQKTVVYGKKLGRIVADLVTRVEQQARWAPPAKENLKQEFDQLFNNLQADLQMTIQSVQQQIDKNSI